jgi:2-C-methyl-D-erythritol 4-phosphate cytidylyltransferase
VFSWSLRDVASLGYVDHVVVVVRDGEAAVVADTIRDLFPDLPVTIVVGGATRHASEWNALQVLARHVDAGEIDVIAIHDAARPLAGAGLFAEVLHAAAEHGGALPVREQVGLLPRSADPEPVVTPDRDSAAADVRLVGVQTPQAFRAAPLLAAYRAAERDRFVGTDTASCVERYTDLVIRAVPCPATNLKITFPEDVALAERLR